MVAAVILAAGRSTRMGRAKALLRQRQSGHSFVGHLIRTASGAGLTPVLVVVRGDDIYLQDEIDRYGASAIVNPDSDAGQLSSLQAALIAVEASGAHAMVILPVDIPLVSKDDVAAVIAASREDHVQIVRATHKGVHGHPVLFTRAVFDELRVADPQIGARGVVRADPARVLDVEVSNPGVTLDIDTPEDYRRAFSRGL
jgi:molybdenum cofactor cytidylyltransferase